MTLQKPPKQFAMVPTDLSLSTMKMKLLFVMLVLRDLSLFNKRKKTY